MVRPDLPAAVSGSRVVVSRKQYMSAQMCVCEVECQHHHDVIQRAPVTESQDQQTLALELVTLLFVVVTHKGQQRSAKSDTLPQSSVLKMWCSSLSQMQRAASASYPQR